VLRLQTGLDKPIGHCQRGSGECLGRQLRFLATETYNRPGITKNRSPGGCHRQRGLPQDPSSHHAQPTSLGRATDSVRIGRPLHMPNRAAQQTPTPHLPPTPPPTGVFAEKTKQSPGINRCAGSISTDFHRFTRHPIHATRRQAAFCGRIEGWAKSRPWALSTNLARALHQPQTRSGKFYAQSKAMVIKQPSSIPSRVFKSGGPAIEDLTLNRTSTRCYDRPDQASRTRCHAIASHALRCSTLGAEGAQNALATESGTLHTRYPSRALQAGQLKHSRSKPKLFSSWCQRSSWESSGGVLEKISYIGYRRNLRSAVSSTPTTHPREGSCLRTSCAPTANKYQPCSAP